MLRTRAVLAGAFCLAAIAIACGETRRPIGDECLRDDDCLSGACAARTCAAAPVLVTGAGTAPPNEEPLLPAPEAGPPIDAGGG